MALLFGTPAKKKQVSSGTDHRLNLAKEVYLNGQIKVVSTEQVPNRNVQATYGLIVSRSYNFDNAFYGLVAQALDANADAILSYRESVAFHPEGDKYFSCYGTAVRLKK